MMSWASLSYPGQGMVEDRQLVMLDLALKTITETLRERKEGCGEKNESSG